VENIIRKKAIDIISSSETKVLSSIDDYTNTKITEYRDFVSIVEDMGFMPLSNNCINFISLDGSSGLTESDLWHTNLPSDPWMWRVQIVQEHKAAYAKLFHKKPGFISLEWYPKFLAARRKGRTFEEMYSEGFLSNDAKKIYTLFEANEILAVHEIKSMAGFTKELNSKYESAMCELQMGMFITVNGTKQKISAKGEEYGWPATAYSTVETWAGDKLIEKAKGIKPKDAMDEILQRIKEITPHAESAKIKRFLGF